MSTPRPDPPMRYCGRVFTADEMDQIRHLLASEPGRNRAQLSRLVCDRLGWLRPDGRRKDMSCRVAMLRMERDGLITLPPPEKGNGNGRHHPRFTAASDPQGPIQLAVGAADQLLLRPVHTPHDSRLWNELIERYHYLGYKPLPGAQIRYLVFCGSALVAALGFGAAAWKVAPRDRFIGWNEHQRRDNLHRIVNNARFLILPWVTARNLASRILATAAKRLPPGLGNPIWVPARPPGNLRAMRSFPRHLLPGGQLDPRRTNPRAGKTGPPSPTCPPHETRLPLPPPQGLSPKARRHRPGQELTWVH
jgi:hypothetical protein